MLCNRLEHAEGLSSHGSWLSAGAPFLLDFNIESSTESFLSFKMSTLQS